MDRFPSVIPQLDCGIQLKILKVLVLFTVFWTPWTSHGVTGENDPRRQCLRGTT
ncbi:MAG: hypothetical protein ACRYE8_00720 [Janthinobacterium lividum]